MTATSHISYHRKERVQILSTCTSNGQYQANSRCEQDILIFQPCALPQELWSLAVKYLIAISDLKACRLVSRSLCRVAASVLFADIELKRLAHIDFELATVPVLSRIVNDLPFGRMVRSLRVGFTRDSTRHVPGTKNMLRIGTSSRQV